jgi:hypothetical protein
MVSTGQDLLYPPAPTIAQRSEAIKKAEVINEARFVT